MENLSLLRLLQLVSSNLPVGGFVYSQGLELACEKGWVKDGESFLQWQTQLIEDNLVYLELPSLIRCYQAISEQSLTRLSEMNELILASRETNELRVEERQRANALARLITDQYTVESDWKKVLQQSQISGMAWLAVRWDIPLKPLLLGYAFNYIEAAVLAGIKLVPFGQLKSQQLLQQLSELLPEAVEKSLQVTDEELGGGFPLQVIASSAHETQYSRLFRS